MSNALAYQYKYEDEAADNPIKTQTLSTHRRSLPFTVMGEPDRTDEQENTVSNSYAAAPPRPTKANDAKTRLGQALPTNEASKSRQWMSGSLSGVAAPSSFAPDTTDLDLADIQQREWQVRAPGLDQTQLTYVPDYAQTLRSRRRARPIIQAAEPIRYSRPRPLLEKIVMAQPVAAPSHRAEPTLSAPALPRFEAREFQPRRSQQFVWLETGLEWLVRNKLFCGLAIVIMLTVGFVLPNIAGKHTDQTIYAYSDLRVSSGGQSVAPPAAVGVGNGDNLLSAPSITPDRINQVLNQYHSPAAGVGQVMYTLGQQYGIDPAFALAFFIHESSAGTQGVAAVTKSIGNIRVTPGYDSYQGFRKYATWEAGIEDWYKLIKNLYIEGWHLNTLQTIVPKYAPSADHNDPIAYINQVHNLVVGWRNGK